MFYSLNLLQQYQYYSFQPFSSRLLRRHILLYTSFYIKKKMRKEITANGSIAYQYFRTGICKNVFLLISIIKQVRLPGRMLRFHIK